jgi:hypothetical protein
MHQRCPKRCRDHELDRHLLDERSQHQVHLHPERLRRHRSLDEASPE